MGQGGVNKYSKKHGLFINLCKYREQNLSCQFFHPFEKLFEASNLCKDQ